MYIPNINAEDRLDVLHQLIQEHPLGTLVTLEASGLNANHLPFELVAPSAAAPFGTLRAHVARANPIWKNLDTSTEAIIIFQGPHAYISASWYEEKKISGKEVPTFNYAVVHAFGKIQLHEDPAWLMAHLHQLTDMHEVTQENPWQVSDAPKDYIEKLLKGIIGIEIPLTKISGKWKVSQNRNTQDARNVAAGLRARDKQNDAAMAALVESRSRA